MLGYVRIDKGELKVREYDIYTGYYCGICKSIGKRYGQLPRMVLSYDAAFLGILLSSLSDEKDAINREHCVAHHIQKKPVISNSVIDYAADVMLILAWYKLADDVRDEGRISARLAMGTFNRIHRKLYNAHTELCTQIEALLDQLSELEDAKCDNLDQVSDSFAQIMRIIFADGVKKIYGETDSRAEVLGRIGYHLGKWIYLADAVDDIDENHASGSYNPLFYRFNFEPDKETTEEFKKRIEDRLNFNLYQYLAVISQSLEDIEPVKYKGILDNIIYFGLNHQTRMLILGQDATTTTDMGGVDYESI